MKTKHTLASVQEKTFISKSTVDRFVKEPGFSSLRNFQAGLANDFEEIQLRMTEINKPQMFSSDYASYFSSPHIRENLNQLVSALKKAKKIYLYGNQDSILNLYSFISRCTVSCKPVIDLCDWDIVSTRKKLEECTVDDCLLLIDTNFNLHSLEIRLQIEEGVLKYNELAALSAKKIFIGREGSTEDDRFFVFDLPAMKTSFEYHMYLSVLDGLLWERMA